MSESTDSQRLRVPAPGGAYWILTLALLPAINALITTPTFWLFAASAVALPATASAGMCVVALGAVGVSSLKRIEDLPHAWRASYVALSALLQGSIAVVTAAAVIAPRLPH